MVAVYLLGDLEFGIIGINAVVGDFRPGCRCKLNRFAIRGTCTLLSSNHGECLRVNDGQAFLSGQFRRYRFHPLNY